MLLFVCIKAFQKRKKRNYEVDMQNNFYLSDLFHNLSHSNIFTNECRIGKRANKGQESTSKYSYTDILVSAEKQEDNQ